MAATGKPPKTMSSRLAGMKFMQRSPGSPNTPTTPVEPAIKKQRLSNGLSIRAQATPVSTPEDDRRAAEVEREALSKGESKWYLSYNPPQTSVKESPLRIVSAGFGSLDAADRDEAHSDGNADGADTPLRPSMAGRKSFGNFKRTRINQQDRDASANADSDSENDSTDEGELEDDPSGVNALINQARKDATEHARAERKAKKQADAAESTRLAAQRRTKTHNLNSPQSISSGGQRKSNGPSPNLTCHKCGQKGHVQRRCPN